MRILLSFLFLFCFSAVAFSKAIKSSNSDKVIVCYFESWAVYRPDAGKFDVENIDFDLCTHHIYTFAGLENNKIISLDPYNDLYDDYGLGAYLRFTKQVKAANKVSMLAIGGWNEGSDKYSQMVSSDASRKVFVDSVVAFLKKYNFEGLDVDWEYPTQRGGQSSDRANYIKLLMELRAEFDKNNFVLTAAVSAGLEVIDEAYDVPSMSQYLDHIHVMAYDFHGGDWESYTGINSPLHPRSQDTEDQQNLTVEKAINYWIEQGAPKNKLVLGIPLYGHTYSLQSNDKHDIFSPSNGVGNQGPYTQEAGMVGYNEVCEMKGYTVVRDETFAAPYMYKDNQWISYDDPESITKKVQYLNKLGLRGAMVWSIDTDDFLNKCGTGKYPLMNAIKKNLQ